MLDALLGFDWRKVYNNLDQEVLSKKVANYRTGTDSG